MASTNVRVFEIYSVQGNSAWFVAAFPRRKAAEAVCLALNTHACRPTEVAGRESDDDGVVCYYEVRESIGWSSRYPLDLEVAGFEVGATTE